VPDKRRLALVLPWGHARSGTGEIARIPAAPEPQVALPAASTAASARLRPAARGV